VKKLLQKNLSLKIIAVLFSVILWIFATHRGLTEMILDVPLEFKNVPQGLVLVNHNVKLVSLSIEGQERLIRNVRQTDARVYIDLSEAKRGKGTYSISKDNLKLARWVTVTNINPSSVKVVLERLVTKTVRVKPVIVGTLKKGFYVTSIDVVPQSVVIEGKSSEVKRVNSVKTEPFDITGCNEPLTQYLRLDVTGRNIKIREEDVKVTIVIEKRRK